MINIQYLASLYLIQIENEMGSEIEKEYVDSVLQLIGFFVLLFIILAVLL